MKKRFFIYQKLIQTNNRYMKLRFLEQFIIQFINKSKKAAPRFELGYEYYKTILYQEFQRYKLTTYRPLTAYK